MTVIRWLILITAISLSASTFVISRHTEEKSNEMYQQDASRMKRQTSETLNKFINVTQAIPFKMIYVPFKMHQFNKIIPFQEVYNQLKNLQYTLRNLDPSSSAKQEIEGRDVNYIKTSYPKSMSQNSIYCAEQTGSISTVTNIVKDRLDTKIPTATRDEISISGNIITCTFSIVNKKGLSCIQYLSNIATTLGLEFYEGSPTQIQSLIFSLYQNTVLYPVLDETSITLQEDPRTIVYCTLSKQSESQKPDDLTKAIQSKFYKHLSLFFSSILNSYETILSNQEHLYALLLNTRIPNKIPEKPFADQCQATLRYIPVNIPSQISASSYQTTTFLQNTKENSLKTTALFDTLRNHIKTLCESPTNEPIINQFFQSLQLLTLNIQSIIQSQVIHSSHQNQTITFPAPLPILVNQITKTADVDQLLYNIFGMRLTPSELSYIYTMIENEKTKTLLWLKNLLPSTLPYPSILKTSQIIEKANIQSQPTKTYSNHPELLPPNQANNQSRINIKKNYSPLLENIQSHINIQNDQPQSTNQNSEIIIDPSLHPWDEALQARNQERTDQPSISNNQEITTTTPSLNTNIESTNPPLIQILQRKKRHWLSQAFSDLTGLATQTDLNILSSNEDKMKMEEEKTQQELKTLETKTQNIIQIIDEQAVKMSKLYSDEAEVKQAIQKVIKDERDVIMQLAQLTTSMEIQSDISIEFSTFTNALTLIPHMLNEIEECLLAVTTQSIYSSLLPTENLLKTIPLYAKQSILSATISATINSKQNTIEISLPEFINPYTVYYIKSIPFAHNTSNRLYTYLHLENQYVAVNPSGNTFLYNPNLCSTKNTISTCNPAMIEIHKEAQTCIEALMSPSLQGAKQCLKAIKVEQINTQSYIYKKDTSVIRLFSPFQDKISTLCNDKLNDEAGIIAEGYTDLSFKSNCILFTSQLVIYSPFKPTVEETIKPLLSTPNLSQEIEDLINEIQEVHKINLTTLGKEFEELNVDIQNELLDITKVTNVLEKAAKIKELTIFDPTDIKLEKISEPNTALKIVTWSVALLAFALIAFCIISCCPLQIFKMLKATFKGIFSIITCTCTTAFLSTTECSKFLRRRSQHIPTSPATNSELNDSSDQPAAAIRYVPHTAYRRRLFPTEEDSDDELTVFSAKRHRQQYNNIQKNLNDRRSQSFETTQFSNATPPYGLNIKSHHELYPPVPSAPFNTLPATHTLEQPNKTKKEENSHSWQIIKVNSTGALLTRQASPQLYFHARSNKTYTLEGTFVPIERPPRNLIIEYQELLQTLPSFSLEQIRLIQSNNSIQYDNLMHTFYTPVIESSKRFYHFAFKSENKTD
jgi:hypothetical protein